MPSIQPPPIKTPFDDLSQIPNGAPSWFTTWVQSVTVSLPWTKWFQTLITAYNAAITYTPTVTAGSGSFTTVSATGRYRQIGKLIFFQASITITTNGSAAGSVLISLPLASANVAGMKYAAAGNENNNGFTLTGVIPPNSSQMTVLKYDGSYPGADADALYVSGFYEIT